ncbi:hypothetical protein GINT2_000194 [Glugoides intestinalis]
MQEKDLMTEFTAIVEQYRMSPFGFRLRKTGGHLKLIEYNGLLYLDNDNLYKIVNELLGPNVPLEIKQYLDRITFSEIIVVETSQFRGPMPLTCTQFVDYVFFSKCAEWIKEVGFHKAKRYNDSMQNIPAQLSSNNANISFNFFGTADNDVDNMFPFREIWRLDDCENTLEDIGQEKLTNTNYVKDNGFYKPRGKQMDLTKDSLKDRPYACEAPFCARAFKRYEHLKRHMKMHTGDRPFKCNFENCDKSFSRSDNLNQHLKIHKLGGKSASHICFKNSRKEV